MDSLVCLPNSKHHATVSAAPMSRSSRCACQAARSGGASIHDRAPSSCTIAFQLPWQGCQEAYPGILARGLQCEFWLLWLCARRHSRSKPEQPLLTYEWAMRAPRRPAKAVPSNGQHHEHSRSVRVQRRRSPLGPVCALGRIRRARLMNVACCLGPLIRHASIAAS